MVIKIIYQILNLYITNLKDSIKCKLSVEKVNANNIKSIIFYFYIFNLLGIHNYRNFFI